MEVSPTNRGFREQKEAGITQPYLVVRQLVGIPLGDGKLEDLAGRRVAVGETGATAAHLKEEGAVPVRVDDLRLGSARGRLRVAARGVGVRADGVGVAGGEARDGGASGRERLARRVGPVPRRTAWRGGEAFARGDARVMRNRDRELTPERRETLRRARRLEWITIAFFVAAVALLALMLGPSQAMKTAWFEDLLSLIPPVAFLLFVARYRYSAPRPLPVTGSTAQSPRVPCGVCGAPRPRRLPLLRLRAKPRCRRTPTHRAHHILRRSAPGSAG